MDDIAIELAKKQRAISVAEFFEKNRHLLGFDSKRKAILTCIKEAVDNSLDACEEMNIQPDILVKVSKKGENKYKIIVEDNGPGIVKEQIPKIFGSLLYGSKFHTMKQSRGQQGIGISASVLYAQLTTGTPAKIISKTKTGEAYLYELIIDVTKNAPEIITEVKFENFKKEHGTRIELVIEAVFLNKGQHSVEEFIRRTSLINPHAKITFVGPDGTKKVFKNIANYMPRKAKEIKPHPYGIELGILLRMLKNTNKNTLLSFLQNDFSRIGSSSAKEILKLAKLNSGDKPHNLSVEEADRLLKAMQKVKLMAPPTDCLSPIGQEALKKSMEQELGNPAFVVSLTRAPTVYRGMPFQIEVGLAYDEKFGENTIEVLRFANKVPLSFEKSACVITKTVNSIDWKRYGLKQSGNTVYGPVVLVVHMASVWVPFTSEGKQAIASYPIIEKEIKLALMELGRKLKTYIAKKYKEKKKRERLNIFIKYAPLTAKAIAELTDSNEEDIEKKILNYLNKEQIEVEEK